jgi:hypothetical protein
MDTDPLPLRRPLARGANACHVLAVRERVGTKVAACGISCGSYCGDATFEVDMTTCPRHGEPICEQCREVLAAYAATGEWHGVEDDLFWETGATVCQEPGCPTLIPADRCWCYEHLTVCNEPTCEHGAHLCSEPAHFCEHHGGPSDRLSR